MSDQWVSKSPILGKKLGGRRFLFCAIICTLVLGGCNLLGDKSSESRELSLGQTIISPDEATEISLGDGASLIIPEVAFNEQVVLLAQTDTTSDLPQTTAVFQLVSDIYVVEQEGFADLSAPLDLKIPYDPKMLPEGANEHALTIVWWNGETWLEIPSNVDQENQVITAEISHFSFFAAAWSSFTDLAYDASGAIRNALYDATYSFDAFSIHYNTQPSAGQISNWSGRSQTAADMRPPMSDADGSGVPDYVENLGGYLAEARQIYDGGGAFDGVSIPVSGAIHVFVLDLGFDPVENNGEKGVTSGRTSHIEIHSTLDDFQLRTVAAHELYHYWQLSRLNVFTAGKHFWWAEATASWAEDEVFDAVWADEVSIDQQSQADFYYHNVKVNKPSPPLTGYLKISKSEYYAAVSLAKYLEAYFPGFVSMTYDPGGGLRYSESWAATFRRILSQSYNAEFDQVLNDYFVSYYYHWDFDPDIPLWFGSKDPRSLADTRWTGEPGMYERGTGTLNPLSGRLIAVTAHPELSQSSLVIMQHTASQDAKVFVLADRVRQGGRQRAHLPGEVEQIHRILITDPMEVAIEGFGGEQADEPVNRVYIVATNTSDQVPATLELEAYVLQPPEDLRIQDLDADPVRITWLHALLPLGEQPEDMGARKAYRLYRQAPGELPILVAEVEGTQNHLEMPLEELTGGREGSSLFVRTLDKYNHESPDSNRISLAEPPSNVCLLIPEGPGLTINSSEETIDRLCYVSYLEDPEEIHTWIGNLNVERFHDTKYLPDAINKAYAEFPQRRATDEFGETGFEVYSGKLIDYQLTFRHGPYLVRIQALEGYAEVMRSIARQVDQNIAVLLGEMEAPNP